MIIIFLSHQHIELHQVTLLLGVLLDLLAIFQDASLIAKLLKTFLELLWGCLAGIILYCDRLVWHRSLNALDTLLKAKVALDFILTSLTVHLWGCGEHYGLDVLGKGYHCHRLRRTSVPLQVPKSRLARNRFPMGCWHHR